MTSERGVDRVSRLVDVNGRNLVIYEHTEMENEAGAVVWDAALVLLNYFCQGISWRSSYRFAKLRDITQLQIPVWSKASES